jgi:hypothetical protein
VMGWPETGSQWRGRFLSFPGGEFDGCDILGGDGEGWMELMLDIDVMAGLVSKGL